MNEKRLLSDIAYEIQSDWKNIYFGALPYLKAMQHLNSVNDMYGQDNGRYIVAYFLGNATTWRGEVARRVKKELNDMIKK